MVMQLDDTAVKLHTDLAGHVWYAAGTVAPRDSGQIADVFLLSSVLVGFGVRVRLLGVPENAELITALYLRRKKNEIAAVEIAGPNICEAPDELYDPEIVMHRMRATTLAAACGGWHELADSDFLSYALIARLQRANNVLDAPAKAYLYALPVYRALSFIPTLSDDNAAQLIKTIVDPRWYVDRRAPERQGKLELYMGLTPAAQKRVSDLSTLISKPRELRCSIVLDTWKTVHDGAIDLTDPQNFLYRVHKASGGGWRGDLRGSQALLRYLRYNWLESLERRRGPRDRLFAPDLFFKTPGEIESYLQHMAT